MHFAIDYLANPDAYELGDMVAVIGVGNSAMDVARTVIRHGSRDVTLYARGTCLTPASTKPSTPCDGAKFEFGKQIIEINDDGPVFRSIYSDENGNITGMRRTPSRYMRTP